MPTQMSGTIKRQVKIYGVEGMVNVAITEAGVEFWIPGTKGSSIEVGWPRIVESCFTPNTVPSFLFGKPLEFLKHQALKVQEKRKDKEA